MKLHPILFSPEMVRAILEGRKTQTRRIVKPQPGNGMNFCGLSTTDKGTVALFEDEFVKSLLEENEYQGQQIKCRLGKPREILWVRETFGRQQYHDFFEWRYKADWSNNIRVNWKWKPSIHMPFTACRLFLKIKSIRVERLHDISEVDAKAEGVEWTARQGYKNYFDKDDYKLCAFAKTSFITLWESINDNWDENPWVWVIEFSKTTKPHTKQPFLLSEEIPLT